MADRECVFVREVVNAVFSWQFLEGKVLNIVQILNTSEDVKTISLNQAKFNLFKGHLKFGHIRIPFLKFDTVFKMIMETIDILLNHILTYCITVDLETIVFKCKNRVCIEHLFDNKALLSSL